MKYHLKYHCLLFICLIFPDLVRAQVKPTTGNKTAKVTPQQVNEVDICVYGGTSAGVMAAYAAEVHIAVPVLLAEAWTDELLYSVQSRLLTSGFLIDRIVPGAFTYETSDVVSSLVIARRLPGGGPTRGAPRPEGTSRFYTTRVVPEQAPLFSHFTEKECQP